LDCAHITNEPDVGVSLTDGPERTEPALPSGTRRSARVPDKFSGSGGRASGVELSQLPVAPAIG